MENSPAVREDGRQAADLSVIIPVFNQGKNLAKTVNMMLQQKNISYEIIIIDNHSTDDTTEIAEKLASNDKVVLHVLPEHKGQSAVRNLGISMATGKYVTFLNAGDFLLANVAGAIQAANATEADVLRSSGYFVPKQEEHVHFDDGHQATVVPEFKIEGGLFFVQEGNPEDTIDGFLKSSVHLTACGKIFRREFLLEHDIKFPEDVSLGEGLFFQLHALLHSKRCVLYRDILYLRNNEEFTLTRDRQPEEVLQALLETEARGLERLGDFFNGQNLQHLLPSAKEKFCRRMDQAMEPLSLQDPAIWERLWQKGNLLFNDAWWISRHLAGWHQRAAERRNMSRRIQMQQAALTATEGLLDVSLKAPRIFVLASIYTMLLCVLYFRDWDKSIFVCGGGVPSSIIKNLKKQKITCFGQGDSAFISNIGTLQALARYAKRNSIPIYGNDDPPEAGQFIEQNFTVVEDGGANYYPEAISEQQNVRRITVSGEQYLPFGFNRFVKHILLTGKYPIPDIVKDKVEIIRIQKLWNQKSRKEQDKILELYSFPRKELEQQLRKGRDCLLIGGAHASVGMCKEEQELAVYREMMEPYGEKRFIIKPHHQNIVDFHKHFPECYVLPKAFPIDLVKLLGIKFHKVIGAASTSLSKLFPPKIVEDRIDLMKKHGIPVGGLDRENKKQG